jgi:hypothetical protein
VGDSGNGAHLIYPLDLPRDDETAALLKAVLTGLARRHAEQLARLNLELDQAVGNPARLTKLYGTLARKGDNTPERPHRLSRIISLPMARTPVPIELLKKIAGEATPEDATKTTSHGQTSGHFDIAAYLDHYNVEVIRVKTHGGGKLYCLKECIFDPHHTAGESAIGQAADGKLFYQFFTTPVKAEPGPRPGGSSPAMKNWGISPAGPTRDIHQKEPALRPENRWRDRRRRPGR